MRLFIIAALLSAAPLALAAAPTLGVGQIEIFLGRGCDPDGPCHPDAYAWVFAVACMPTPGDATLEAERLVQETPVLLVPMDARATGTPECAYRAQGRAEFWMDLVEPPLDCLRGSVLTTAGVAGTRAQCFSDL